MNRLLLVLSLLAFTVSGSLGALYWQALETRRELTTRNATLDRQLESARELASSFQKQAVTLDVQLGATKSQLASTETRAAQLATDLTQTKAALAAREQAERTLRDEIGSLQRDLADTRAHAIAPEAAAAYKSTIAELERQLATAKDGAALPTAAGASTAVFASRPGRSAASIVSVGPENSFVVLNYGSARGARIGQKFILRSGAELMGAAVISDVRAQFSVAQVEPDSLHGVLHKGDLALLTP
jgi:septal ring factor EnvC (AmiA/AmiB activator)